MKYLSLTSMAGLAPLAEQTGISYSHVYQIS